MKKQLGITILEFFLRIPVLLFQQNLDQQLKDCDTILDVGCGYNSPLSYLNLKYLVGIEGFLPSVKKAQKRKTHDKIIYGDVIQLHKYFKPKSMDCCVALDVIEHLTKKQGRKLIKDMLIIARKKIIIFTPNGFLPQFDAANSLEEHLSGWTAKEMTRMGFEVTGFFGHKSLRGEFHRLKFRPKIFWGFVSELTNLIYSKKHPVSAASILCVKKA